MATVQQFLIVCPLTFLAGFIDAIAGGGGLISLPAYLMAGLPAHYAIGTNKLSSGMGTAIATAKYAKNGYIPWKSALICATVALVASNLGAQLNLSLNDSVFQIILLIVLPLTAIYVFTRKTLDREKEPFSIKKTLLLSMLIALIIGLYDGFYGPGTGTFLILLLTNTAHLKLREANGVAKVINLTTNFSALAVMLYNGKVMIVLGLVAGFFSILGNYIGTRFFEQKGSKIVKPIIFIVLAIFFVTELIEVIG